MAVIIGLRVGDDQISLCVRERERERDEMREMIKLVRIQVENRLGISFRYGCVYVDVSVCIGLEREYRRRRRLKSR